MPDAPAAVSESVGGSAGSLVAVLYGAVAVALLVMWRGWRPGPFDGAAWRPTVAAGLAMAVSIVVAGVIGALAGSAVSQERFGGAVAQMAAAAMIVAQRRRWMSRTESHPVLPVWAVAGGLVGLVIAWPLVQLASALGSFAYATIIGGETPTIAHESLQQLESGGLGASSLPLLFSVIVAAPFVEEVLYRAVIQQLIRAAGAGRFAAVGGTAVLFALMHLGSGGVVGAGAWSAIPALFVLGLLFGVLYERTGRLAAPVAAHALFNVVNVIATLSGAGS